MRCRARADATSCSTISEDAADQHTPPHPAGAAAAAAAAAPAGRSSTGASAADSLTRINPLATAGAPRSFSRGERSHTSFLVSISDALRVRSGPAAAAAGSRRSRSPARSPRTEPLPPRPFTPPPARGPRPHTFMPPPPALTTTTAAARNTGKVTSFRSASAGSRARRRGALRAANTLPGRPSSLHRTLPRVELPARSRSQTHVRRAFNAFTPTPEEPDVLAGSPVSQAGAWPPPRQPPRPPHPVSEGDVAADVTPPVWPEPRAHGARGSLSGSDAAKPHGAPAQRVTPGSPRNALSWGTLRAESMRTADTPPRPAGPAAPAAGAPPQSPRSALASSPLQTGMTFLGVQGTASYGGTSAATDSHSRAALPAAPSAHADADLSGSFTGALPPGPPLSLGGPGQVSILGVPLVATGGPGRHLFVPAGGASPESSPDKLRVAGAIGRWSPAPRGTVGHTGTITSSGSLGKDTSLGTSQGPPSMFLPGPPFRDGSPGQVRSTLAALWRLPSPLRTSPCAF